MDKKDVGVKKCRGPVSLFMWVISIAFALTFSLLWWGYTKQAHYKYLHENVIEVEAKIDGYEKHYYENRIPDWSTYYKYQSDWGTNYSGLFEAYITENDAKSHIGESVTIFVDPISEWSATYRPTHIYERVLITAVVFTLLLPLVLYLLIYRFIYRNSLNTKIRKKLYGRYYNSDRVIWNPQHDAIQVGEVVEVFKLLVCYVKVRYRDEDENKQEKWARSWFTHREAKFLERKKFIKIVPYKNTYGILEEMPIERKKK